MHNLMLLSKLETTLVVIMAILVIFFAYFLYNNVVKQIIIDIRNKKKESLIKKSSNIEDNLVVEKEVKKEKNLYNDILDKVHQNREQYYKDFSVNEDLKLSQSDESKMKKQVLDYDNNQLDFNKLGLFDDFEFDDNAENNTFDDFEPENNHLFVDNFKNEIKRKRMLKRNLSIGEEINQCSDRIKAILVLDIINKKKF